MLEGLHLKILNVKTCAGSNPAALFGEHGGIGRRKGPERDDVSQILVAQIFEKWWSTPVGRGTRLRGVKVWVQIPGPPYAALV